MGNCSTMSVVEDFFEKFEKGELREAEKEVVFDGDDLSSDASVGLEVTVDQLTNVENVVAVLVKAAEGDDYAPLVNTDNDTDIVSADGSIKSDSDNVVNTNYYNVNTSGTNDGVDEYGADGESSTGGLYGVKIIARGY